jgi:phage head maturation protease
MKLTKASIKGLFEEALSERTNSFWNLADVLSWVLYQIDVQEDMADQAGLPFDYEGQIRAALAEFTERVVAGMVEEEAEEEASEGMSDGDGESEMGMMAGPVRGFLKRLTKRAPQRKGTIKRQDAVAGKTLEYKVVPSFIKSIEGRTVTGIFAVHGNMDAYNDVSYNGSFTKTMQERGPMGAGKIMHLWNHNMDMFAGPPVAVVKSLREVGRDELPPEVLKMAPTATGGAEVVREYLDTPRGNEVLAAIKAGAVTEMSYAYDAVKFDFSERDGTQVRNLYEEKLYETSDVLWGANDATLASKGLLPTIEVMVKQWKRQLAGIKAGARHSASDYKLINSIHDMASNLGATSCKGIVGDEGETENEDGDKSRAAYARQELALTLRKAEAFLLDERVEEFLSSVK